MEKKASEVRKNETVVQLEILDASVEDKGAYMLEATAPATGETQKQELILTEEQVESHAHLFLDSLSSSSKGFF